MNEPTLGNLAINILAALIVGALSGVGVVFTILRNSKKHIDDTADADRKLAKELVEALERKVLERIAQLELLTKERAEPFHEKMYALVGIERARIDRVENTLGDAVHDLQKADAAAGVQLAVLTNTVANIESLVKRLEGVVSMTTDTSQKYLSEILAAIKAGRTM